jgi:HEPN domain-containing protein
MGAGPEHDQIERRESDKDVNGIEAQKSTHAGADALPGGGAPGARTAEDLIEQGSLERIARRRGFADYLIARARRHLASAALLAQTDDTAGALAIAYWAARMALSAILAAQGIRVAGEDNDYAVLRDAVWPQLSEHRDERRRFDWLRTVWISTQDLDAPAPTKQDVADARSAATAVADLAERLVAEAGLG